MCTTIWGRRMYDYRKVGYVRLVNPDILAQYADEIHAIVTEWAQHDRLAIDASSYILRLLEQVSRQTVTLYLLLDMVRATEVVGFVVVAELPNEQLVWQPTILAAYLRKATQKHDRYERLREVSRLVKTGGRLRLLADTGRASSLRANQLKRAGWRLVRELTVWECDN